MANLPERQNRKKISFALHNWTNNIEALSAIRNDIHEVPVVCYFHHLEIPTKAEVSHDVEGHAISHHRHVPWLRPLLPGARLSRTLPVSSGQLLAKLLHVA